MKNITDIEDIDRSKISTKISKRIHRKYTEEQYEKLEEVVLYFLNTPEFCLEQYKTKYELSEKFMRCAMRKFKISPRKEEILYVYRRMKSIGKIFENNTRTFLLESCFKKKDMRETSGVMVFAVLSSPFPETGEFAYIEKGPNPNENIIYVGKNGISKTPVGDKITIDCTNGKILSFDSSDGFDSSNPEPNKIEISYVSSVIFSSNKKKSIVRNKNKTLHTDDNVSHLINPLTGELRQSFSCPFDCYFCPTQPNMPKSYQDKEPAVSRSLRHGWNVMLSMRDRFEQYVTNGMNVDKMEVIIKGGTWTSYNEYYRRNYCRDIFYTANTFWDPLNTIRKPYSLLEEQKINETAKSHVIGITIETRPDYITEENLIEFRECGITRVELGFQHTDNKILKKINRGHSVEDSARAISKLLSCGFKVDIHLMPGLPGSTYEKDKEMVTTVLKSTKYQVDQFKWYPTIVTPYTVLRQWYEKGKYKPWVEDMEKLLDLTVHFKTLINPWNRTNRIQRDFTADFICGGSHKSNLGDMTKQELRKRDIKCWGIRAREVRNKNVDMDSIELVIRSFKSSSVSSDKNENNKNKNNETVATEYFISYEANNRDVILGFIRLRLDPNSGLDVFPELHDCAMIRELHVYGKMNVVNGNKQDQVQHLGLGTKLVNKAKEIALKNGYKKISVIAGVGVRNYYRKKHNFKDGKNFLICNL